MKKLYFLIVLTVLACRIGFGQGFIVQSFTADIYISPEGYFDVVENYDIEFTESKHGILREFITKFDFTDENGKVSKREIYISDIDVPGEHFQTNEIFGKHYNDKLNIRIGDRNTLVNGNKHYEIRYRVKNAFFFTNNLAQLYWNIKPADWLTVFNKVNFTIHTPDGAPLSSENCYVYSGDTGNTEPSTEFDYDYSDNNFSGSSTANFNSNPGQNITVLVKLPKSLVQEIDFTPPIWKRYGWIGFLALFFLSIFIFIKLRLKANKVIVVISFYPPQKLDPAMVGMLIDNTPNSRDITCLLPYWATKGIIRMEEIPKGEKSLNGDLKFIKLKDLPQDVQKYESNFFDKIFNGKKEILASRFPGSLIEPMSLLAKESEQYYNHKKAKLNKLKLIVLGFSWLWAFSSIVLFPIVFILFFGIKSLIFIPLLIINFIFFFLIFPIGFALIINKTRTKNKQGASIMPELLGFYQFIKIAEVDRIRALLKEDPYYFEKTMPYAMAFNLLKEWTTKFEGLIHQAPDWYSSSSSGTQFKFHVFASSFISGMSAAKTLRTISTSTSSSSHHSSFTHSGGGSSGGGAGGGGGRSW